MIRLMNLMIVKEREDGSDEAEAEANRLRE